MLSSIVNKSIRSWKRSWMSLLCVGTVRREQEVILFVLPFYPPQSVRLGRQVRRQLDSQDLSQYHKAQCYQL